MSEPAMDVEQILGLLPHRYPFVLVDRILDIETPEFIRGLKNVTINEPFFQGHFPGHPVMPGVLMVEAMAQLAGVLALATHAGTEAADRIYYLAGTDDTRFKRRVVPGDQLVMEARLLASRRTLLKFDCVARVDDQIACSSQIMCVGG